MKWMGDDECVGEKNRDKKEMVMNDEESKESDKKAKVGSLLACLVK